jgi:hypothetical protein
MDKEKVSQAEKEIAKNVFSEVNHNFARFHFSVFICVQLSLRRRRKKTI